MKGDRQKCLDAGASDYIAKPVDIDLLLALLRVWIGRAEAPRRATAGAIDTRPPDHDEASQQRESVDQRRRAPRSRSARESCWSTTTSAICWRCPKCSSDVAEVVTATSGREALRHLLKGDFAVILLDVFMPGMDGYETAA